MLGIEISDVCIARTHDGLGGAPVQQMQEMPADAVVVGLHLDALAVRE